MLTNFPLRNPALSLQIVELWDGNQLGESTLFASLIGALFGQLTISPI